MPPDAARSRPLNVRIALGFAAALAILFAIGVDSYRSMLGVVEDARRVAHTHEVLSTTSTLYGDLVYTQSSRRGYVLTGDEDQARRAGVAAAAVRRHMQDLRRLTADNPGHQARLDRLEPLAAGWLAQVEESIERRRRTPGDRETQAAMTVAGSQAADEIRARLGMMADAERALLAGREARAQAGVRRSKWVIVIGSAAACLLVGVMSLLLHRESVQRGRAEEDLRRSEALYRTVLSQFPNGSVLLFDHDLRYRLAEGAGLAQVGLSKEALEGRTIWECLPAETCAIIEPYYRAALEGRPTTFDTTFRGVDRSVYVSPVRGSDGRVTYGLLVTQDITERKQVEGHVRRLNTELERKVAEADAANKELEAFSYSVSHDLRAPVRHINGFVDLLQRRAASGLDETARRHLGTIARASRHMGQLIDDLLAFSRTGRGELARGRIALGPLVQGVIDELRPETEGRVVEWKVDGLPEVSGDPALLRVVFTNLVGNAVKYTRPRPQAVIEIGQAAGRSDEVVMFVRDNGVGFDMQYADKLFGVFQRLHRSDEFEGTGIGLATVRRIVRRHGGRTWAESSVGGGATFYVALPAGEDQGGLT